MLQQIDVRIARRIALAAIIQAVIDASKDDPQAESWLFTTGLHWMDWAGVYIDPAKIRRKIRAGSVLKGFQRRRKTTGSDPVEDPDQSYLHLEPSAG